MEKLATLIFSLSILLETEIMLYLAQMESNPQHRAKINSLSHLMNNKL